MDDIWGFDGDVVVGRGIGGLVELIDGETRAFGRRGMVGGGGAG